MNLNKPTPVRLTVEEFARLGLSPTLDQVVYLAWATAESTRVWRDRAPRVVRIHRRERTKREQRSRRRA